MNGVGVGRIASSVGWLALTGCLIDNPLYGRQMGEGSGGAESDVTAAADETGSQPGTTVSSDGAGVGTTAPDDTSGEPAGTTIVGSADSMTSGAPEETGNDCVIAPEVCDGVDNDCDGKIDEWSEDNAACNGCALVLEAGHAYAVCEGEVPRSAARATCESFGSDLVKVEDEAENDFLVMLTDGNHWIGLNDLAAEGRWVWADGTPMDYENFGFGEPNGAIGDEDCVYISSSGGWADRNCDNQGSVFPLAGWICEDANP